MLGVASVVVILTLAEWHLSLRKPSGNQAASPPERVTVSRPFRGPALGPLRVLPSNTRYFTADGVHAVYLAGSHTWANLQDQGTPAPSTFDYNRYMNFMKSYGVNVMRLWTWWFPNGGTAHEAPVEYTAPPYPWVRSGPGMANDGKAKFDFARLDQNYFDRMRRRTVQAGQNGIYVSVMLFNGYEFQFDINAADGNPFESTNNINGISCSDICPTEDAPSGAPMPPPVWAIERAYIRKVIDTVNDLGNVIYEVSNESGSPYSDSWQAKVIAEIRGYEATKPKQHPIGMTFQYKGGTDTKLYASGADWISPSFGGGGLNVPPDATGNKVILNDTDHDCGICDPSGIQAWAWENFARGNNLLFMDPYLVGAPISGWDNAPQGPCLNGQCRVVDATWDPGRNAIGDVIAYAGKIDLAHMTPQDLLSTSKYCLASPGSQYLVYSPSGSFTLSTAPGTYTYEWFDPATHIVDGAGVITVGIRQVFTAPFRGESVLWLHR